jgi:hypothetical protein
VSKGMYCVITTTTICSLGSMSTLVLAAPAQPNSPTESITPAAVW